MKKNMIILVLVFAIAKLYGQTYFEITFDGEGAMPETVIVENLTQGTSVEMEGTDVLHLMLEPSQVTEISMRDKKIAVFPNPMEHTCKFEFQNSDFGNVSIKIYSITGKKIFSYNNVLDKGSHSFILSGVSAGSYIISVQTEAELFTGRFVSTNQTEASLSLKHNGEMKSISTTENWESESLTIRNNITYKGYKSIVEMDFDEGDHIKFTAKSEGFFNSFIYDSPTEDKTYTFNFILKEGQCDGITQFTDPRDGIIYNTIGIGDQCWMVENLKYLPSVVGPETTSAIGSYYYVYAYDGNDVNEAIAHKQDEVNIYEIYGVLYNWSAARSACPAGWYLPSDEEWADLEDYLGGDNVAGDKLKDSGVLYWDSPGTDATNESGFTALPGGRFQASFNAFYVLGVRGYWWTDTEFWNNAWVRSMDYDYSQVNRVAFDKMDGISVRCIRDTVQPAATHILNLEVSPENSGEVSGAGVYEEDEVVTVTATANEDYVFVNWTGDTDYIADANESSTTITMPAYDISLTANFEEDYEPATHNLTLNVSPEETGEVSGAGVYEEDEVVTVTATANEGYVFVNWTGDTDYIADANESSTTVTMPAYDITLTANFEEDPDLHQCGENFTDDRDLNVYQTVQIGDQCWMASNLKYLPEVVGPATGSDSFEYYYVYDYNGTVVAAAKATQNYINYGVLYNYLAATNACPPGWHLPSDDEWKQLESHLGMAGSELDFTGWRGTNQGSMLAGSANLWDEGILKSNPNFGTSGFNARPGSGRAAGGVFFAVGTGKVGFWWTSTMTAGGAFTRDLSYEQTAVSRMFNSLANGHSVRCVKN